MTFIKDNAQLLLFGQQSERLRYRKLVLADFEPWLRFCEDPPSLRYFGMPEHHTPLQNCELWFERAMHRYENNLGGMNALEHKTSGKLVGQCGLLVQTIDGVEELEIGYSLMPEFRSQGYASEAARFLRDYTFLHALSDSLISIIHVENEASARVALANGMHWEKTTVFKEIPVNVFRIHRMPA